MSKSYFEEKVIVITGASSGIGKELALRLARQGALLVLAARDEKQLAAVYAQCEDFGAKAAAIPTDGAEKMQCERLFRRTVATSRHFRENHEG